MRHGNNKLATEGVKFGDRWESVANVAPQTLPRETDKVLVVREAERAAGMISRPPPVLESRIIQTIASRYTDYAIPAI